MERDLQLRLNPRPWIVENLQIRTKDQRIVPLAFNEAQAYYDEHRTLRDIILKPRQLGFTTQLCAYFFADCLLTPNTTSVIVAHDADSTQKIFRIAQLFWERLPEAERARAGKTRYSNRKEFFWPKLESRIYIGTAGAVSFGRGQTINNLHCCEFAFWPRPEESLTAMLEAVPTGGRIVIESTANGMGNYFHDLWKSARESRGEFNASFFVWWENPENAIPGPTLKDLTKEEQALITRWGLTHHQIRWRRWKKATLRDKFLQENPEDDVSCFLSSGRCVFDTQTLLARLQAIAMQPRGIYLPSLALKKEILPLAPATLIVWKKPEAGRYYVIGADVGEGLERGDASPAMVVDFITGEQVAELHGRVSPERFARQLAALGYWYNTAQIGVERENHGHSCLNTLRNVLRYPNLYYSVAYDAGSKAQAKIGWTTNAATKPILVDDLAAAVAEGFVKINSPALIDEMLTFVTTDTGSQEAQEGKFDDRVIALGIAWQVRKRGPARASSQRPIGW